MFRVLFQLSDYLHHSRDPGLAIQGNASDLLRFFCSFSDSRKSGEIGQTTE